MRNDTASLYPYLFDNPALQHGHGQLLAEVRTSSLQKAQDIATLRTGTGAESAGLLVDAAIAIAAAFAKGHTLFAFGNGGSATDAQDVVADCILPDRAGWRSLPAISLVNDIGTVTGVANDVGFENVFLRQLIALAQPGDIAIGFTTSGSSASVVSALEEARRRGLLTVAFTGYDGGLLAHPDAVDFCFVARSEHIPRIQEAHATLWHTLLELVHECLTAPIGVES